MLKASNAKALCSATTYTDGDAIFQAGNLRKIRKVQVDDATYAVSGLVLGNFGYYHNVRITLNSRKTHLVDSYDCDCYELTQLRSQVAGTFIGEEVTAYAVALIQATRTDDRLLRGASPRATLALVAMSKAVAQLRGRGYVVPKDVQEAFVITQAHRLEMAPGAIGQGMTPQEILEAILSKIPAPKLR